MDTRRGQRPTRPRHARAAGRARARRAAARARPTSPALPPPAPGWIQPDPAADAGPRLDLGLVVGRTFDTLGREWSLFLALALPAGIGGFISGVLSPSVLTVLRAGGSTTDGQVASLVLQSFVAILTGVTTLATIVAADGLWRGTAVGLGEAIGRAVAVAPRAIALFAVVLVATVGLTLFLTVTVVLLQDMAPAAGADRCARGPGDPRRA